MKTFCSILAVWLLGHAAFARIHRTWSYEQLTHDADCIVIATPVSVFHLIDALGQTTFPDIVQMGTNNVRTPVPAVGIETTFAVLSVLKGGTNTKSFVLYHLAEAENKSVFNGPQLIAFEPKEKKRFLLFLKREPDGRFTPLTGQVDPVESVKDLGAYP